MLINADYSSLFFKYCIESRVNWCKVLQFLSVAYVACGGNVFCEIDDFDIQYVCTYVHVFK